MLLLAQLVFGGRREEAATKIKDASDQAVKKETVQSKDEIWLLLCRAEVVFRDTEL